MGKFSELYAREITERAAALDPSRFDPEVFFGRWFMSRKKTIPREWFEHLAAEYPYSGRAFRLDTSPHGEPYASWCRTTNGLVRWKMTMHPFGQTPSGMTNYTGTIDRGIDVAAFVRDTGVGGESGQLVMDVEEVTPIVRVTDMRDALK